ncbi:probable CCR4-associated factor 1 homolog 9 [Olea europaea var. sylvestris]|uniref:probable CCR4-associated factor 1 homolog 9 n=1 Tax=Olea europaea var. sylvestris TaxID=158386 RepID=UPI000C1CD0B1|nr:probable CCR4-associated factor 1 homolog 9 [Olea europaea var. sylvestris]
MNTEFFEVIYHYLELHLSNLPPSQNYSIMKKNVDAMKLIQMGLTLFDPQGYIPDFGIEFCFIWKFNFMEFSIDKDLQNSKSIALLRRQGIDFTKNKLIGISSADFAFLFLAFQLSIATRWLGGNQTWITFHSTYDFGFLKTYFNGPTKELLNAFNYKLFDPQGNLPDFGIEFCFIWKFNFIDFGVDEDLQSPKSIALLKRQDIDYSMNKLIGISSADFAFLFMASRLSIATRWLR